MCINAMLLVLWIRIKHIKTATVGQSDGGWGEEGKRPVVSCPLVRDSLSEELTLEKGAK